MFRNTLCVSWLVPTSFAADGVVGSPRLLRKREAAAQLRPSSLKHLPPFSSYVSNNIFCAVLHCLGTGTGSRPTTPARFTSNLLLADLTKARRARAGKHPILRRKPWHFRSDAMLGERAGAGNGARTRCAFESLAPKA